MFNKKIGLFLFFMIPIYCFSIALSKDILKEVSPYLLPSSSEVKQQLDEIFKKSRVILNIKTLKEAGFINAKPRKFTRIIVTAHQDLPGYIFKIYLDAQRHKSDETESVIFLKRVKGALAIAKFIEENELDHLFKVPKKWIYLLPQHPAPPKEFAYKNFILVVEDMHLLSHAENKKMWSSSNVTAEILIGLHSILQEIGLRDCAKIDNIPFSEDGKIAFIDTQSFGFKSVPFKRLKKMLSSEMQDLWDDLCK